MPEHTGPVVLGVARHQPSAVAAAVAEANRRRTGLRVVHSVWLPAAHGSDDHGERLRDAGHAVLDAARLLVEQEPAPPTTTYVLSLQPPVTTLMDEADAASCLVLGTDDVEWYERMIGGEIAVWLAGHASCPVLVVPESPPALRGARDVVVALDVDTLTGSVLEEAFEQTELRRCRLHVLHAVPPDLVRAETDRARSVLHAMIARASAGHPSVRVVTNLVVGEADETCLRVSEHASLLLIGRPHQQGLGSLLSRSVAVRILREARSPVLVVPGPPTSG